MSDVGNDAPLALREAPEVARRALALCAVVARAYLEEGASDPHTHEIRDQLQRFLHDLSLNGALSERERGWLAMPVGALGERDAGEASWRSEELGIHAWALGRVSLSPTDALVEPKRLSDALGFLEAEAWNVLESPLAIDLEALLVTQARLQLVEQRLLAHQARPRHVDLSLLAERTEHGALLLSGLVLAEGDLAIDGAPLAQAPTERWEEVLFAAVERSRAVAWLLGA